MTQKIKSLRKVIEIEGAKEGLIAQQLLIADLKVLVQHQEALQLLSLMTNQKADSSLDHAQGLVLDHVQGQNQWSRQSVVDLPPLSFKLTIV